MKSKQRAQLTSQLDAVPAGNEILSNCVVPTLHMSNASPTNSITGESDSKSPSGKHPPNTESNTTNLIPNNIPGNHRSEFSKTDNGVVVTADGNSDSALPTSSTTKSSKTSAMSEETYSESYC